MILHASLRPVGRSVAVVGYFALFLLLQPAQAQKLPPAVSDLLPAGAQLARGSFAIMPTEFGKTFSGEMRATIPGRPSSCDITIGPELRVSLKGDTAWEEPPMLDAAVELFNADILAARKALPQRVEQLRRTNASVQSVASLREEKVPGGVLIYVEYTEDCARHKGSNTVLRGFARKGATMLNLDLWISAGATDATAMAKDMMARFAKLNVPGLLR
ncbi:MAG: hypothetical protein ABS84_06760 [Rubrivivax sp. SCN 71-131]|jgi:hypothetical protein|nr:MAG: hypothetical protein ABS84_06760 [Rubrivivax sp. SCN 71-131]